MKGSLSLRKRFVVWWGYRMLNREMPDVQESLWKTAAYLRREAIIWERVGSHRTAEAHRRAATVAALEEANNALTHPDWRD